MPELEIISQRSKVKIESDGYLEPSANLVQALSCHLDAPDTASFTFSVMATIHT
jgi:hypothetical protein